MRLPNRRCPMARALRPVSRESSGAPRQRGFLQCLPARSRPLIPGIARGIMGALRGIGRLWRRTRGWLRSLAVSKANRSLLAIARSSSASLAATCTATTATLRKRTALPRGRRGAGNARRAAATATASAILSPADVRRGGATEHRAPPLVSLTGGEPLIHAFFPGSLAPEPAGAAGTWTNGTPPEPSACWSGWTSSAWTKLASVAGTDAVAAAAPPGFPDGGPATAGFVKIVVGAETPASEVDEAARMVAAVDRATADCSR